MKTVARESSHLRDGQSQHLGDVSGGISLHPSELRSRTSYLALRDGRSLGSGLTLDALRGLALAGRARHRSLALEARPGRFHEIDDLRLRRLGRLLGDLLALLLTLDLLEDAPAHVVFVRLGPERLRRGLLADLRRELPLLL